MARIPKNYITLRDPESNYGEDYNRRARTKFNRVAVDPQVGLRQRTNTSKTNGSIFS